MLVVNLPFKALIFLTLMRPSLVLFLVLWLKLVNDFLKVRCRLALLLSFTTLFRSKKVGPSPSICFWRASQLCPSRASAASCSGQILLLKRSEEHTSELQSRFDLVCRLLLEKKKSRPHTIEQPLPHYSYLPLIALLS